MDGCVFLLLKLPIGPEIVRFSQSQTYICVNRAIQIVFVPVEASAIQTVWLDGTHGIGPWVMECAETEYAHSCILGHRVCRDRVHTLLHSPHYIKPPCLSYKQGS